MPASTRPESFEFRVGRLLAQDEGRLPHRGSASDSETDRVVRPKALQGGSDEHQNGFSEAEILDSLDVIERMRAAGTELVVVSKGLS